MFELTITYHTKETIGLTAYFKCADLDRALRLASNFRLMFPTGGLIDRVVIVYNEKKEQ